MKMNRIFLTLIGLTALTITACSPQETVPGGKKDAAPTAPKADSGTAPGPDASAPVADVAPIAIDTIAADGVALTADTASTLSTDSMSCGLPGIKIICVCPDRVNAGEQVCLSDGTTTLCGPCTVAVDAGNTADTFVATPDTAPAAPDATPVALDTGSDNIATNGPEVTTPPVCVPVREICGNLIDEDCDGLVDETDCSDPTATATSTTTSTFTATNTATGCANGQLAYTTVGACTQTMQCVNSIWQMLGGLLCPQGGTGGSTGIDGGSTGTGGSIGIDGGTGGNTGTGGSTGTGGTTGTGGNTGTGGALGCHALVNNQYTDIPNGQIITCASGNLAGQQTCQADGTLTACVATNNDVSGLRTVIDCTRLNESRGKVVVTGNVASNLWSTSDYSDIAQVCLVGDSIGGYSADNRRHCLPYHRDSSYRYVYDNNQPFDSVSGLPFNPGINRLTIIAVTVNGTPRWAKLEIMVYDNEPANRCSNSTVVIDDTSAKTVYNN